MLLVFAAVALAVVFVIAAVVIGRESGRLSAEAPRPVFDFEEAVAWVADDLPFEVAAALSHDDVRRILGWNLDYLRSRGASANGSGPAIPEDDLVIVGGAEAVEQVLARARAAGLDFTGPQVHAVLEAQLAYLQAIGAAGPAGSGELPPS